MDVFVARQPIFDRESRVYAYELLYRSNADFNQFTGTDEDRPTLEVIAGSLLTIGLTSIAGGKKAFINFGRNLLVDGLVSMLPRDNVVIEVLETAEPDAEVVDTCRKLRKLGYTIALDDFAWHPRFEQLIEVAHVIKIDMRLTSRAEQERLVSTYQPRGIAMLAEKVETREEFEWAANLGYDYFQGYFFARPAIISAKEIQPAVFTCLQLLKQLQSPELDFKKLETLISADVALAYKLFRYVNSVLFARRGNIQSIRRALAHLARMQSAGGRPSRRSLAWCKTNRKSCWLARWFELISVRTWHGKRETRLLVGLSDRFVLVSGCPSRPAARRSTW